MASVGPNSLEALNELFIANAMLDKRMSCVKMKIIMKRQDTVKISEDIRAEHMAINKIEDELIYFKSREMKASKTIQGLQQSKTMLEHLEWNLRNQLKMIQNRLKHFISQRTEIIEKYKKISDTFLETYKCIRSSKEREIKKTTIALNTIKLMEVSHALQEYHKKVNILKRISELIFKNNIVNFVKLMNAREKASRNVVLQLEINRKLEEEILALSERKQSYSLEKQELVRNEMSLTIKKASSLTHFGKIVPSISSPILYTSIRERLGIHSSFSRPSVIMKHQPEPKELEKSVVEEQFKEDKVSQAPVEYYHDVIQPLQVSQVTQACQETEIIQEKILFSQEQEPAHMLDQVKPTKKKTHYKKNVTTASVKTRSKQQRRVFFKGKPLKTVKADNNLAEELTQKNQHTVINCNPEKLFTEFSPKAMSTEQGEKSIPGLFTSLYNFPSAASVSVISPPPFQPTPRNSTEKDFSSIFGGSSQKSTDSSFFNLF